MPSVCKCSLLSFFLPFPSSFLPYMFSSHLPLSPLSPFIPPSLCSWLQFQAIWRLLWYNLLCSAETWPGTHHLSVCVRACVECRILFWSSFFFKVVFKCAGGFFFLSEGATITAAVFPRDLSFQPCLSQHVTQNHKNTHSRSACGEVCGPLPWPSARWHSVLYSHPSFLAVRNKNSERGQLAWCEKYRCPVKIFL